MSVERAAPCKVNLFLSVLGKRDDGFHELETILFPLPLYDRLFFSPASQGIELLSDHPSLPVDSSNLVHRAATAFLDATGISTGIRIRLQKEVPIAAGLGGGSSNAAHTLTGMNELFGFPLASPELHALAAKLGSDVPFFLQSQPALGTGRGEIIQSLPPLPALSGAAILLIHPGFGVSTPWAYQALARGGYGPGANAQPRRAAAALEILKSGVLSQVQEALFNSLEGPVLAKHPLLKLFQDFLKSAGAAGSLMSGSGSTTFALFPNVQSAKAARIAFHAKFGDYSWACILTLP